MVLSWEGEREGMFNWDPEKQGEGIRGRHKMQTEGDRDRDRERCMQRKEETELKRDTHSEMCRQRQTVRDMEISREAKNRDSEDNQRNTKRMK